MPNVQVGTLGNSIFQRAPKISTVTTDQLHYGYAFLFIKPSTAVTTYDFKVIITCDVEFFTYTGNNGLSFNSSKI